MTEVCLTPFQKASKETRSELILLEAELHRRKLWFKCALALDIDVRTLQRHFKTAALTVLEQKTIFYVLEANPEEKKS